MFWVCAENSVDNIGMFSLLPSSAYGESRPFLLLRPPHQQVGWGCTRSWGHTHSWESWPQLTKGISHAIQHHAQHTQLGGRRRKGGGHLEWWHLSSQVTIVCEGALLSWRWLNTCLPMGSSEW